MIKSRADYYYYCDRDKKINGKSKRLNLKDLLFPNPSLVFLKYLRKYEYYLNTPTLLHKVMALVYYIHYRRMALKTGISIPRNVFGAGLCIPHFGTIVVNATTKVGKNCMIHACVNIGTNGGSSIAPVIGDNVYIGPGAKIYGEIVIADNCYIGANAVVNKSFVEPFSVIVGAPAKVVKKESNVWWQKNRINLEL